MHRSIHTASRLHRSIIRVRHLKATLMSSESSRAGEAAAPKAPVIVVGSDHGGFDLKTQVVAHLKTKGVDIGTLSNQTLDCHV